MSEEKPHESNNTESKDVLPLLPLRGTLVYPFTVTPLDVGRERSVRALEDAMVNDRRLLLAAQKEAKVNEPETEDIYSVGTVVEVKQIVKLPEGQIRVLVEGICRAYVSEFVQDEPFYRVRVQVVEATEERTLEGEALIRNVLSQFEQYIKLSKKIPSEIMLSLAGIDDAGRLADTVASQLNVSVEDKQKLLEAVQPVRRLQILTGMLAKEMDILELERKIHLRVRKQMEKTQKEYYLREQMKAIQKELGEKDERVAEIEELERKIKAAKLPKEALEKANYELGRLEKMPPMVAEAVVVRNYLDWILSLPWNKSTKDRLDLDLAEKMLDEDHFGLEKVKERILEFLAVRQLAKKMKGPILCLVGPPGVGKTSLGKSVARALDRKFVRFSLGGIRDEAEIRGHRRTYVGAMPGKVIQALRQAGSRNPVMLLDEVDKMSSDFRGDPSSALLEVLDPEQNSTFGDHYMEITFDLSDVLFVTTGNVLYAIPRALRDRMEVIAIPGYTEYEKLQIAKRHLLPKQLAEHGLKKSQVKASESCLMSIITGHTRESGVRSLERNIASVCRKLAKGVVKGDRGPIRLTARNLPKYLGAPRYLQTLSEKEDRVGLATGLAYTEVGGDTLAIEVTVVKGKGKLILTGKLGEVMRESAQAGYSFVRSRARELGIEEDFHERYDVHIHMPEGAVPKDGPSAGIAIACALSSALTGRPVSREVAMTGEITLRGRILPIGGVKEKVLAAHRNGITTVILPTENKKDLEEVPPNIRRRLRIELVDHMDQVLQLSLGPTVSPGVNTDPDESRAAPPDPHESEHEDDVIPVLQDDGHEPGEQPWALPGHS